jgi:ligand-binding SRPBCC domain-containing protein
MKTHSFETELWLKRPVDEVFAFFSDARNLERITPPWVSFRILTPGEIPMRAGALIDYRIRVHGVPLRWQSEITAWDPGRRFVDEQRRGPYRLWIHEHRFSENNGGTLVTDIVTYAVPGGPLVNKLFVANDVAKIFEYRKRRLEEIFSP